MSATHEWPAVAEGILQGLTHEMNNRLLALMGVRELAEDGLDAELARLFDDELVRLETAVALLRRLGEGPGPAEVVEAEPVISVVRELHARNALLRGLRTEWEVGGSLPAIRASVVRAERALLTALAGSGEAALNAATRVEVKVSADDGGVLVEVRPVPAGAAGWAELEALGAGCRSREGCLQVRFVPA